MKNEMPEVTVDLEGNLLGYDEFHYWAMFNSSMYRNLDDWSKILKLNDVSLLKLKVAKLLHHNEELRTKLIESESTRSPIYVLNPKQ